mmetsp:Transcript_119509/g.266762  ORF Transcript_119509/g.266762 Transcript_119509/m.266762 type:complete len:223 (+) Transcript_119509:652-1320(+)
MELTKKSIADAFMIRRGDARFGLCRNVVGITVHGNVSEGLNVTPNIALMLVLLPAFAGPTNAIVRRRSLTRCRCSARPAIRPLALSRNFSGSAASCSSTSLSAAKVWLLISSIRWTDAERPSRSCCSISRCESPRSVETRARKLAAESSHFESTPSSSSSAAISRNIVMSCPRLARSSECCLPDSTNLSNFVPNCLRTSAICSSRTFASASRSLMPSMSAFC